MKGAKKINACITVRHSQDVTQHKSYSTTYNVLYLSMKMNLYVFLFHSVPCQYYLYFKRNSCSPPNHSS